MDKPNDGVKVVSKEIVEINDSMVGFESSDIF